MKNTAGGILRREFLMSRVHVFMLLVITPVAVLAAIDGPVRIRG